MQMNLRLKFYCLIKELLMHETGKSHFDSDLLGERQVGFYTLGFSIIISCLYIFEIVHGDKTQRRHSKNIN